ATHEAAQIAAQSFVANFPELHGIAPEQLPAAMRVLQQTNPQRHAEAVQQLHRADAIGKRAIAAQQQQAQAQQAQLQQWVQQQDRIFEQSVKNESPETRKAVESNVLKIASEVYGVSGEELVHAWRTQPLMRSAAFQRMIYDAVKYNVAQQSASEKLHTPVPPVQRPGVSQPRMSSNDAGVEVARQKFLKDTNDVKAAAAYLTAKRNARG